MHSSLSARFSFRCPRSTVWVFAVAGLMAVAVTTARTSWAQGSELPADEVRPLFQAALTDAGALTVVAAHVEGIGEVKLVVDTGSESVLLLDSRYGAQLGPPSTPVIFNKREVIGARYDISKLVIDRLAARTTTAALVDMSVMRSHMGASLQGAVGWDLLRLHLLMLDFDHGRLGYYARPFRIPAEMKTVPLVVVPGLKLPCVLVKLGEGGEHPFIIDTGSTSAFRASEGTFQKWVKAGIVKAVGEDGSNTIGVFTCGTLFGVELKGLEVDSDPRKIPVTYAGMDFLRRANLILDGMGKAVHYEARAKVAPFLDYSVNLGVRFGFAEDGKCTVAALKPGGGVFEKAGLKVGDEILQLGHLTQAEIDMRSAIELCQKHPGGAMKVRYRRAGKESEASLALPAVKG